MNFINFNSFSMHDCIIIKISFIVGIRLDIVPGTTFWPKHMETSRGKREAAPISFISSSILVF